MTTRRQTCRLSSAQAAGLCLAAVVPLYHIPLGDTLAADTLHALGAAVVALGCAWLGGGDTTPTSRRQGVGGAFALGALCALAALAGTLAALCADGLQARTGAAGVLAALWPLAVSCLGTAVWEEAFFRGLAVDAVRGALAPTGHRALKSACACAAVFALLHMGQANGAQEALRFAQVFLFGLAMSGLRAQTGTLGWAIGAHAVYDLVCFYPAALAWQAGAVWEMPASALAAAETSVPGMLASLPFLLAAAVLAARTLARG